MAIYNQAKFLNPNLLLFVSSAEWTMHEQSNEQQIVRFQAWVRCLHYYLISRKQLNSKTSFS